MKPTYEELEKKCALQQSKLAAINELMGVVEKASDIAKAGIEELQSQNAELAVQLANAESKCMELAAENAGLKAFGDKLDEMHNDLSGTGTGIQGCHEAHIQQVAIDAAIEAFDQIETSSTDAILAEVRAQGVDAARNALIKFVEDEVGPNTNVPGLIRGAEVCVSIAAQLRKGAAL